MNRAFTLASVAGLALSIGACGPKSEKTADSAVSGARDAAEAAGNMASQAVTETENVLIPTPSGQEFADKAAKSDAFEIASAKLAGTNSVSKDVQAFAKEMAKAHADSTTKIKSAAQKANPPITPDPMLTGDQQDKLADLRNLKGADFDRKYISEQVDAHKDALSLMKDYASNGDVPTLKTTAAEIAPIVQRHLDMARSLER